MYTTILHATDLSENHFAMCQKAVNIAHKLQAKLFLLHVIEPPPTVQLAQGLGFASMASPVKDDAETVMAALGDEFNIPREQLLVEVGSIKTHILDKINCLGAELLIIGKHQATKIPAFLCSTAHTVATEVLCDVLTLHT